MYIEKVLNNNAFISLDENGDEIIVMGKGIAFGKKGNQQVDLTNLNYKIFSCKNKNINNKLISERFLLDNIIDIISNIDNFIKNIELLNIKDKSIVLNYDYKKSLNYFKDNNIKFNIIFVDPPYDYDVLDKVISKILEYNLLEKKGILVIEHTKEIKGDYKDLYLYKTKKEPIK